MNHSKIAIAILPLLLGACATTQVKPNFAPVAKPAKAAKPAQPVKASPALPNVALSDQILFEFLFAEIAGQRGNLAVANEYYVKLAEETRDPRIVNRALDISLYSGQNRDALSMAKLLQKLDPSSEKAKQAISMLLVHSGDLEEAKPNIAKTLSQLDEASLSRSLMQLDSIFSQQKDRKAVLKVVQELVQPYLALPEAHYAIGTAALRAGENQQALVEADKALSIRPGWDAAALLHAQVLQSTTPAAVETYLEEFLKQHPKAEAVRLALAKYLVAERKYPEARRQFMTLLKLFPSNQDISLAVALLSVQMGDTTTAIDEFRDLLKKGYKQPDLVRYYLGQSYEMRKEPAEAEKWYRSVTGGVQYLPAQVRVAYLMTKRKDVEGALRHLHSLQVGDPGQKLFLIQAESQLLHDSGNFRQAYDLLHRALKAHPENPDLLYDFAMAAENVGKIAESEKMLKKLIGIQPDNAQAYNALGYTLVEHSTRYQEALSLLEKALELAPEDAYILDSMGWLQYKMGNLPSAVEYLNRAYSVRHDPEIAAHLARALWSQGKHEEARNLIASGLRENPGSDALKKAKRELLH